MPKIDVYKSSYPVYGNAVNTNVLSTDEGIFYLEKGKVYNSW